MENIKIDFHIHTSISDGTDTPEELLKKLLKEKINSFSVTDHDSVKSAKVFKEIFNENNFDNKFKYITGVEFACRDSNGKYHILGYNYNPDSGMINELCDKAHEYREYKVKKRIELLEEEYNIVFPEEEIDNLMKLDNPGKPHIGNMMVKYGYAKTRDEAINDYINKLSYREKYIGPVEVIEAVLKADGIPILAHPSFGSGRECITGKEMDDRIKHLLEFGLKGVEAFYSGFDKKLRDENLYFADKYNLFVTAGSDYHGNNKSVKLGDTGCDYKNLNKGLKNFLDTLR
ncbi:hypothetical protein SAMN02910289_01859 [Lachnospiraceae bacterium RM5]|nr:hypothetical protein SAMN02910289_01859 [Lachnospiraceae bacterium RM5]